MWRYRNFYYFLRINVHASNFHTFESLRATFQYQNKIEYIKLLKNINEFIEAEKSKAENKAYKLLNVIYNKQISEFVNGLNSLLENQ